MLVLSLLLAAFWVWAVRVLGLGFPLLLAAWGLWRLSTVAPARPLPTDAPAAHPAAGPGLVRFYLLASYAAAVQLTGLRQGRALPLLSTLLMFEAVSMTVALYLLFIWRAASYVVGWVSLVVVAIAVYRLVLPRLEPAARRHRIVLLHEAMPAARQSAWGLLGHALYWGSFTAAFICIILREKFK
jgi:hypothetical protein